MTINLDNIEEWVNTLNTMNVCDSKCRQKETIKERRKELTDAIHNYNTAKPRLRQAKHNYMKLIQSETNYNTYLKNENKNKAKAIIKKKKISKDNKLKEIENKVKYFNNSEIFTEALKYKLYNYENEKNNLNKQKNKEEDTNLINTRLTTFYNEKMNYISGFNTIFFYIYYILFTLIFGLMVYKKQYGNIKLIIYIISLGILPFIIDNYYYHILTQFKHTIIDNIYIILFISFLTLTYIINYGANIVFNN